MPEGIGHERDDNAISLAARLFHVKRFAIEAASVMGTVGEKSCALRKRFT